jgi:hypothetical protein
MRFVSPVLISCTRCGFAFGTADDITAAATEEPFFATTNSSNEFHAEHEGHFPSHFGAS